MQDDRDASPRCIDFKRELRIDNLQKKVPFTFTEYFKTRLPRQLCEELTTLTGYRHDSAGGKLIAADIDVENFRVHLHFGMSDWRLGQRQIRIEQVESDVIHASVG